MSMRQNLKYTVLDGATANGAGKKISCTDFRHCIITVDTSNDADMNIKFQGSVADPEDAVGEGPDFEAAQGESNQWDYVQVKDYEDGSAITGDTGITLASEAHHQTYEADINGLDFITAQIYSYTAGNATVRISMYNE